MRKVLLVGDLRPGSNYGAVATTEALLDLIGDVQADIELKIIDQRSFRGTTPQEGYPVIDYEVNFYNNYLNASAKKNPVKRILKKLLKNIGIYGSLPSVKKNSIAVNDGNVPCRFDQYEEFAKRILAGETWQFERKLIEWADIVLVNSEGNIVNGTDALGRYRVGGRYVLFLEYLCKVVLKKECHVVNHIADPKNRNIFKIIKEIYPQLDGVLVRERKSLELLRSISITNSMYVPDALWSHDFDNDIYVKCPEILKDFDFGKPYICLGDSSGIHNNFSDAKWNVADIYTRLIKEIKSKTEYDIVFVDGYNGGNDEINKIIRRNELRSVALWNCSYHELYYVLKQSRAFISGRWHASIISLLANTPIILWGADSHKTEALYGEVDYPYEFFDVAALPLNIDCIVDTLKKITIDDHSAIWEKVEELKILSRENVKMLRQ